MRQFQGARKYTTPLSSLASIKQGPNDTFKAYVRHFNEELATIHNSQENGALMAAISRVLPETPFWDNLKDECKKLQKFYKRADKIMHLETAQEEVHTGKSTPIETPRETAKQGNPHLLRKMEKIRNTRTETVDNLQM